jgi:catechol 2,3-dioxygenase-like lactoylglutathione lyase family enzyme
MKLRVTLITLAVDDLARAVAFYRNMGLETEGIVGAGVRARRGAFFDLQTGLRLALWPAGVSRTTRRLAVGVERGRLRRLQRQIEGRSGCRHDPRQDSGGFIVKPPQDTFWEAMRVPGP